MNRARDFRRYAREDLKGNWILAIIAGLIAVLLGGASSPDYNFSFNISTPEFQSSSHYNVGPNYSTITDILEMMFPFIVGTAILVLIAALILAALYFFLGSVIGLGYARFNLNMVDGQKPSLNTLFDYFPHWKRAAATRFLKALLIFLWSLLFIIPGIIAMLRYSMTDYILAENPDMPAREVLERSKEMMKGNKSRLFCLELSFIGWMILCTFTLGLGTLILNPYMFAAKTIFYRDISGTGWAMSGEAPEGSPMDEPKETVDLGMDTDEG